MARVAEQYGKNEMALLLLEELDTAAQGITLTQWEPELLFEVKARQLKLLRLRAHRYADKALLNRKWNSCWERWWQSIRYGQRYCVIRNIRTDGNGNRLLSGQGDKTTCGGKIIEGADDHTIMGIPQARDMDRVTCGRYPGMFIIVGGVPETDIHGRLMAGTLDSQSSCPCKQHGLLRQ